MTTIELVRQAQAGDAGAFGEIYTANRDTVYRFVYGKVGDRQLAEDLTADTFVKALRGIDRWQDQGKDIAAWLVTIARNAVFDHFKSARYRLERTTEETPGIREADTSTDGNPEAAVMDGVRNAHLIHALNYLSAEQREVLTFRYLRELSISETAAVMGKHPNAIKALTYRATQTLAKFERSKA